VGCEAWRSAIDAMAEGTTTTVDARLVDAHLASCEECGAYRAAVGRSSDMPDLSSAVVSRVAAADRAAGPSTARWLLTAVAIELMITATPDLFESHIQRHVASFSVAYAVGLLLVVARPARARTMLPVAAVLAGGLLITALLDAVAGRVPLAGETGHLPTILSVPLVWRLAVPRRARR
jgi:anti-sigma factor RsiW